MFVQRVALEAVPSYAIVDRTVITETLRSLNAGDLREELDRTFRRLEIQQPALAEFVSAELGHIEGATGQALAYFLFLVVYLCFEDAFGQRLGRVVDEDVDSGLQRLITDGELRRSTCGGESYSEDAIALGQPALMTLVNEECDRAADATPDVDRIFESLLVEVLVLTQAVAPAH
ncbi:MAG: hypothetical protein PVI30_00885 [Myxococcales bacterium]|jgi:hypothetical protein